ncbi:kinase [Micromonospora sp. KC721]|uniref:kinase n=1 Tax=Micromonospora sp. KC721 TaxID=2530380 RepID=UPI00104FA2C6|nr:kinase [Micromonospora sp. KC721]TDB81563.1 kinase [Micromonospora sp. KC721]
MKTGLILYGAPATGKDTVTAELVSRKSQFEHFKRLKVGPGRTTGYRMISSRQADDLRQRPGEILWENSRYGATYFVDRSGLEQLWDLGHLPVVHLGQVEAVEAITGDAKSGANWTVVELYCRPAILRDRIRSRATGDDEQRFAAIEQTPRLPEADIRIDTELVSATEAAEMIVRRIDRSLA